MTNADSSGWNPVVLRSVYGGVLLLRKVFRSSRPGGSKYYDTHETSTYVLTVSDCYEIPVSYTLHLGCITRTVITTGGLHTRLINGFVI